MFRSVFGWLHCVGLSWVSRFTFLHLADLYMLDLEPSAPPSTPSNVPVRMCSTVRTRFRLQHWHVSTDLHVCGARFHAYSVSTALSVRFDVY